ncbi:MAG: circularly permuted type 2 ATP-grasp protein [Gammaproteobacteria bacterium]|nr:circularly permuted type 2 ATP-grasp protein [Gammaproteobacteria bacterium]
MTIDWHAYQSAGFHDELVLPSGRARAGAGELVQALAKLSDDELVERKTAADLAIRSMGITFSVYHDGTNIDREWPFDIVPRLILKREWDEIARGLKQRVRALNAFIDDVYHHRRSLRDGVVPEDYVLKSREYRSRCAGIDPPYGVWSNVCGSDLVRDADGSLYVLEDNLRVPSGVSYMLENRAVMKRIFPELFEHYAIHPVDDYPTELAACLRSLSPRDVRTPRIVVLTPGIYNSAYFEHAYLALEMAAELVEGPDLVVADDDCVYMRTISGLERVDVIYRRIDDLFLDPRAFRKDSMLGVPGLMRAWQAGNVALANAPGCGVADDKVIYTYVPDMIRYFLGEEPILANVPSYRCAEKDHRDYVLDNLQDLVVKPANESGGYGMLIGPQSTRRQRDEFVRVIRANPRNYIGQPTLTLSTAPTLAGAAVEPRHLDLRPFILSGEDIYVTTGGLTRVAMRKGSIVVNSSQGGGSKDTWVVERATKERVA